MANARRKTEPSFPRLIRNSLPMLAKILTAAGCVVAIAATDAAQAADWQYCLALSRDNHRVYMSPPFPNRGRPGDADAAFASMLDQNGYPHDDVQCPRADDENSIATMRQYAIKYNQESGNAIIAMPREKMR